MSNNAIDYSNETAQKIQNVSITSLVLGICGIIFYPVGLILGIIGIKKGGKGMAIAGIIMCSITLLLTIGNSVLGAMIALSAQQMY